MRLPFGLGRRSGSGNGASGGSSDAGTPTVSRSASSGSGAVPARPRAWASLPPIQRAAGSMPLVADPTGFVDALPGTQGLPPVVQQLGHEVSPMATPGLVVARVRSVEHASASIPAPRRGRTAQRQAAGAVPEAAFEAEPDTIEMPVAATTSAPVAAVAQRTASASSSASSQAPTSSRSSASSPSMPVVAREAVSASSVEVDEDDGGPADVKPGAVTAPEVAPVRSLPTVSRSAIRIPDRPLTSAASVVRPVAQRSHAGHSHAAPAAAATADGAAATAPLPAASGGMRRAPSGTTISRTSMPIASRQAAAAATPSTVPSSASTAAGTPASPKAGASLPALPAMAPVVSRLGIGEPTSLPAAAKPIGAAPDPVVSRSTMAGPMPLATSPLRTTIQRAADGEGDGEESEDVMGGAPVQRSVGSPAVGRTPATPALPALPTLPVLNVSRSARDGGASHQAGGAASAGSAAASASGPNGSAPFSSAALPAAASPAHVQRSASTSSPAPAVRPIAAHNPLRPSVVLQRDADADDDAGSDDDGDGGMPSPWWAPAGAGSTASMPSLPTIGGSDGAPGVQRSAFAAPTIAAPAGTASASVARNAAAPARPAPAVQRSSTHGSGPPPRLPLAVPPTPAAPAPQATTPSGMPNWGAPGTVVNFPQRTITSAPSVQTSRSGSPVTPASAHSSPTVQREGPTSPASSGGTAAAAAKAGHSERELDDLAKQLFSRIRTRLRADLLQDREAAGFTFDNV